MESQLHAATALPPWKDPLVPIVWRLCGMQRRSERGGEDKNFQSPPEIEP
jgi:hypothetical protein